MGDEEYWFNGVPIDGFGTLNTGDEEYWFNGFPVDFITPPSGNDFMEFCSGMGF